MIRDHTKEEGKKLIRMMIEGEKGAVLFHVIPDLLEAVHLAELRTQVLHVAAENANIELASQRLRGDD